MSVREAERRLLGEPLTIPDRVAAGLVALVGAAGHVALAVAALCYVVVLLGVV